MEKRRSDRKQVHIRVKLTLCNNTYDAFINNVSHEGIALNIILPSDDMVNVILPNMILSVKVQTGKEAEMTLHCDVKWVNISSDKNVGVIYKIGSEIIAPSDEYRSFITSL